MRILIAPNAFKGSLRAVEASRAMAAGVRRAAPGIEVDELPLADGGEGTLDALLATGGEVCEVRVPDAYRRIVCARFGLFEDGRRAVVESAEAIGLGRLFGVALDPFVATSEGLGALVRAALDSGATELWVALGGSATVDGGAGMLAALGARLLDEEGRVLAGNGAALRHVASVDLGGLDPRLAATRLRVLADVESPLLGPRGARLYMAQKGASDDDARVLEAGLARLADALEAATGRRVRDRAAAGAAGGLGFAWLSLGADVVAGAAAVLAATGFDDALTKAELVLTGEGRIDEQTGEGKLIAALAEHCQAAGKPLVALCGAREGELSALYARGLTAAVPIADGPLALEEMMARAAVLVRDAAETVTRVFVAGRALEARPSGASCGAAGGEPGG